MAGYALLAIFVAIAGITGPIGFVLWLSRGIKREDHSGSLHGTIAPDLVSRTARRCSGLHVRGELTPSRLA